MQQPDDPEGRRRIRFARTFGCLILIATGLVWLAQGLGLPPKSPISGEPIWIVAGLVGIAAGAYIGWLVYADTRRPS